MEISTVAKFVSTIVGIFGVLLTTGYIVLVLNIISNIGSKLGKEYNIERFGSIYSDTNYQNYENEYRIPQFYIIIFLSRRLLYILIILLCPKIPIAQQALNIYLHTLTFVYDIIMKPYTFSTVLGKLIYFLDLITVIIFGTLPLYMSEGKNQADLIGRIHIYILIFTIGISWIIIIVMNIKTLYLTFKTPTMIERVNQIIEDLNTRNATIRKSTIIGLPIRNRNKKGKRGKPKILVRKNKVVIKTRYSKRFKF